MPGKVEMFIKRMQAVFGPPYKDASGEVIGILATRLQAFSEEALAAAVEQIALTRKFATWPMPVEILNACRAEQDRISPPKKPQPERMDEWSDYRCRRADQMIQSTLGVEAAEGGWLDELWHFCRKQERLPEGREVDAVFAKASKAYDQTNRALAKIEDEELWKKNTYGLRAKLLEFYEAMREGSEQRYQLVMKNRKAA